MVIDDEEEINNVEDEQYDQVLNIQQHVLHEIATRLGTIPMSDVTRWVAHHTDFRQLAIIEDGRNVLGLLTPKNFQKVY